VSGDFGRLISPQERRGVSRPLRCGADFLLPLPGGIGNWGLEGLEPSLSGLAGCWGWGFFFGWGEPCFGWATPWDLFVGPGVFVSLLGVDRAIFVCVQGCSLKGSSGERFPNLIPQPSIRAKSPPPRPSNVWFQARLPLH